MTSATSATSWPVASTIATALNLARSHPEALLPCPRCAAHVKGANLGRHLEKVHGGEAAAREVWSWRGEDHAIIPLSRIPLAAWALVTSGAALGGWSSTGPVTTLWVGALLLAFVFLIVAHLGWLPATLSLDGDVLRLGYVFGLRRREVPLGDASIEVGGALDRRPSAVTASLSTRLPAEGRYEDVDAGGYLRLEAGGASIVVTTPKGLGMRSLWDDRDFGAGEKRRRWDVTLPRPALVALQYELAARGKLRVREAVAP